MVVLKRLYIGFMIVAGVAIALFGISRWSTANTDLFVAYLALAAGGAIWKVKLPGVDGTFSAGAIPVLISIAILNLGQVVVIAVTLATMQTIWRPRCTSAVKAVFNGSMVVVTAASAFGLYRLAMHLVWVDNSLIAFNFAALAYYLINITLLSAVIALDEGRSFSEVWHIWYLWSFPYYLSGAAIATLAVSSGHRSKWIPPLVLFPIAWCAYYYFRRSVDRYSRKFCRW